LTAVIEVSDLSVRFAGDHGEVEAVDGASFEVREGEILGLVGESGSGKSVTATAILRLISKPGRMARGRIVFGGRDLCTLREDEMQHVRGAQIAMVSQTPRTSLNPLITVGQQVARLFALHGGLSKAESRKRAIEMLTLVGIPEPERRSRQYAHQFSGGMCQRVMIAMALATSPRLLIADEPTTGLDVSTSPWSPAKRTLRSLTSMTAVNGRPACADRRPAARPRPQDGCVDPANHTRSGRGRHDLSSRCRHACRPDRRGRAGALAVPSPLAPLHARSGAFHSPHRSRDHHGTGAGFGAQSA
jgi:ABC-type dipeptide/oligopeptide/nickel transport system ATPase subunit